MTQTAERLKTELETLPVEDRAELAYYLLQSLDLDGATPEEVEAAWDAELARREAEIKSGKAVGIPLTEVLAELREKYP